MRRRRGCTGTSTPARRATDRKSTRLNSSHGYISYAVFCLKKKKLRQNLAKAEQANASTYRLIVIGGHTRSIGKTQFVCDLIAALPAALFIAGKITQYGHRV